MKLSDTACILLSHAAQQRSGTLHPLPASLFVKNVSMRMAIRGLRKQQYVDEIMVKDAFAASCSEGNHHHGLPINHAELVAIDIELKQLNVYSMDATIPDRPTKATILFGLLSQAYSGTCVNRHQSFRKSGHLKSLVWRDSFFGDQP